jgi:3-oxoacyl-(acyl-carrier-protein) synthase
VVVAGDVLSASAVEEYRRRGLLTGGDVRPCDHSSDGAALSGVSIAIVLQGRGRGRTGRPTYGDVLGGATVGVDAAPNQPRAADPWERAIHQALCSSGVAAKEIDYVVASAAGSVDADRREMSTVSRMIGSHAKVTAPKGLVGDSRSAAGLIGVLVSGLAFERGVMVGMPWLRRPMCSGRIEYVSQTLSDRSVDRVLVNAGSASAVGSVVIGSNSRTTMNGVRSK